MIQRSKITDCYIASSRLDFLYSKLPIKEWRDLPYYGKATADSAGGYNGFRKVAYSFRQSKKGGQWTDAAKTIMAISNNPGSSPAELRNIVGIKDGFCASLFDSLRLWMLVKSIKGKYYLTNTGVQYASKMLHNNYKNVKYYDFVTERLVDHAENEFKISKIPTTKATVRIEIPAGRTNEEVKDILDKAYTADSTAQ